MDASPPVRLARIRSRLARWLSMLAHRIDPKPRRVLLIDLENFGVQSTTRPIRILRVIERVRAAAGPVDRVVVGVPRNFEPLREVIESCGVTLVTCAPGRDAADRCLLALAEFFPEATLVVASGDRAFAPLAAAGRVARIIAISESHVSQRLSALVSDIVLIPGAARAAA